MIFRCEPVREVDECESVQGYVHAVVLVAFLVAVNPAASVKRYDYGELAACVCGTVDIETVAGSLRAVSYIVKPRYA